MRERWVVLSLCSTITCGERMYHPLLSLLLWWYRWWVGIFLMGAFITLPISLDWRWLLLEKIFYGPLIVHRWCRCMDWWRLILTRFNRSCVRWDGLYSIFFLFHSHVAVIMNFGGAGESEIEIWIECKHWNDGNEGWLAFAKADYLFSMVCWHICFVRAFFGEDFWSYYDSTWSLEIF